MSSLTVFICFCILSLLGLSLFFGQSLVTQSCLTLSKPMDCSLPGSSVLGISQARILEWVAVLSPGDLPNPGIELVSPALAGGFSYCWVTWEAPYRGWGCLKISYLKWFWVVKLKSLFKMISILTYFCTHHQSFHFMTCQLKSLFNSVQLLSRVLLFATPLTTACQASLSITNSQSSPKPMSIESVMPSNHLILCRPLLLLPLIFPSIRVFSNESALHIRWPKYWSFSFSINPSNEYPGLISFRMDWLDRAEH